MSPQYGELRPTIYIYIYIAAEIVSGVWGITATFKGFRVFAALLQGSQVVSVSQTLRR